MRVAILLIGNEILSGKVEEQNAQYLVRELRTLGADVRRIEVVPDDPADIAATVKALAGRFDVVFSSGGVGPTHDDVTLASIATAFGMTMERNAELESLLRRTMGAALHERDLRMADLPSGARLEYGPRPVPGTWPVVVVRNVWVLPGVPSIFRRKFESVRELFRSPPIFGAAVYSLAPESLIADTLDAVVSAFPDVEIGSYPHLDAVEYRVKITLDGRQEGHVREATHALIERLGVAVWRVEEAATGGALPSPAPALRLPPRRS